MGWRDDPVVETQGGQPAWMGDPEIGAPQAQAQPRTFTEAELLAGSPAARFAMGAASPFLGAAQLAAEATGNKGVTEHLGRVEELKHAGMTLGAALQRLKAGRETMARMPGYEAALAHVDRQIADAERQTAELRAMMRPDTTGVDVAGLAGAVLSPAVLGTMKIPAAASMLGRAGQGAAIGAGFGAAAPVTDGGDYWATKAAQVGTGALLGAAVPPAIDLARKGITLGRNILDPMLPGGAERAAARVLAEAAGPKRAAIEAELAKDQVFVPGSQPTAAEAAARAGSPEFSALQKIAQDHSPSRYTDIARAQEAARAAAVGRVAQSPEALKAAEAARSAAASKAYGAVADDVLPVDDTLKALFQRPTMVKALDTAQKLAAESGRKLDLSKLTVRDAQTVKMALDDLIGNPNTYGIGAAERAAAIRTRSDFFTWMGNKTPGWAKAREAFAAASKPINEMQVGAELEKALTRPIGEGERAHVFAGAVREAPRTLKKATGTPRFDELEDVLTPENVANIKGVLADLGRKAEFERLAPIGRSRAAEAAQPFGLPATGPLNQSYMVFKTVLGRVTRGINDKTLDTLAEALELPVTALKLLQRAPTEMREQFIDQIISLKLGRGAIAAGTSLSGRGFDAAHISSGDRETDARVNAVMQKFAQ